MNDKKEIIKYLEMFDSSELGLEDFLIVNRLVSPLLEKGFYKCDNDYHGELKFEIIGYDCDRNHLIGLTSKNFENMHWFNAKFPANCYIYDNAVKMTEDEVKEFLKGGSNELGFLDREENRRNIQ